MFYHVSKKDLGEIATLTPKVPENSLICSEGNIPRICVSTDVYYCLRSITGGSSQNFYVNDILYEIREDLIPMETSSEWIERGAKFISPAVYVCQEEAFIPPNACDFKKNNEHWYISSQEFIRIGYLDLNRLIVDGQISLVDYEHKLDGKHLNSQNTKSLKVISQKKTKKTTPIKK